MYFSLAILRDLQPTCIPNCTRRNQTDKFLLRSQHNTVNSTIDLYYLHQTDDIAHGCRDLDGNSNLEPCGRVRDWIN